MATIKCRECNKEISSEAKECRYCGAPVKRKWGCLVRILVVVVGLVLIGKIIELFDLNNSSTSSSPSTTPVVSQARIPYQVAKRWQIPNGGEGKLIVIGPQNANEGDMVVLGQNLKQDVKSDRNAFIYVYTTNTAADMRDRLEGLSSSEKRYYSKNFVGSYFKNGNTGFHEFQIYPQGIDGPTKTINLGK